jgi:prophage DNA circulation protein
MYPFEPQVQIIDTGEEMVEIRLTYLMGLQVSQMVWPEQAEGQKCKDLIAAMRRKAER